MTENTKAISHNLCEVLPKKEGKLMGPFEYKVISVEGEYATLLRTDNESGDTIFIALALLPPGTDVGTRLLWENLEYKIL